MTQPIPHDLWQHLCALLAQYPNCQATLNAHAGQVCSMDIRIHVKAGEVPPSSSLSMSEFYRAYRDKQR